MRVSTAPGSWPCSQSIRRGGATHPFSDGWVKRRFTCVTLLAHTFPNTTRFSSWPRVWRRKEQKAYQDACSRWFVSASARISTSPFISRPFRTLPCYLANRAAAGLLRRCLFDYYSPTSFIYLPLPTVEQRQKQEFRPLEYWKPPKAVRHIRSKSSTGFLSSSKGNRRTTFSKSTDIEEGSEEVIEKHMSFNTIGNMADRTKNAFHMGPPPAYKVEDEDTLSPRWYDAKRWGKKVWIAVGAIIAIIIIIVVVGVVEGEKKNAYPDYSKLSYSLTDTSLFSTLFPLHHLLICYQFLEPVSSTSSTTTPATTPHQASFTTSTPQ